MAHSSQGIWRQSGQFLATHWGLVAGIVLAGAIPCVLAEEALEQGLGAESRALFILNWLLSNLACAFISGAIARTIWRVRNGERVTWRGAMADGLAVWVWVFATDVLLGLLAGMACLLLLVPGIYLLVRWALATQVVVFEGKGGMAALIRAGELSRGRKWWFVGVGFLYLLAILPFMGGIFAALFGLPAGWGNAVADILGLGISLLGGALTVVMAHAYVDAVGEASPLVEIQDDGPR